MKLCNVGLWKLPGITFEKNILSEELINEMQAWANENHCGTMMTPDLWSFKTEALRDWFVLRWTDRIPKPEVEKDE
jgi:hypothetical protein